MNFAVIDIETVNDSPTSIATIGVAGVDRGKIIETAEYHVKPEPFYFDSKATAVNGLKEEDFINAPTFSEVWGELSKWFSRYDFFVAHNASFDFGLLRTCCIEYNLTCKDFPVIDTLTYSKNSDLEVPDHKLNTLCNCLNVSLENHHSALCDAIATAGLMVKLIELNDDNILEVFVHGGIHLLSHYKVREKIVIGKPKNRTYNPNWKVSAKNVVAADVSFSNSNAFSGMKVVISGDLASMNRAQAYSLLKACGAEVCDNLTLSTNYLITNAETTTGKIKKAMEYIQRGKDIKIINESKFLEILEANHESD